jgi:hypothetical protein
MNTRGVRWLLAAAMVCSVALAQGQLQQPPQPQIIKPKLSVGLVAFAINLINSVEIQGREVDAFLEVRKVLTDAFEQAQKANRKLDDQLTLEFQLPVAQNLVTLLQRARITGADAERFKQLMDAITAAAQQAASPQGGR